MTSPYLNEALNLHDYLVRVHERGGGIVGPDSGIRFNYRLGRFIKSYAAAVPWRDDMLYLQAQAYWILANWTLHDLDPSGDYATRAVKASELVVARQDSLGGWSYPNPEWGGRVATAEGTWACLGLLESYRQTGYEPFLAGVRRWARFLEDSVGFVEGSHGVAVNYFAHRARALIPNNSAILLRFLSELQSADALSAKLAERSQGLLSFLRYAQTDRGEIPYSLAAPDGEERPRPHFQCFQYNAFQLLDLLRYRELSSDRSADRMLSRLSDYIATGVGDDGLVAFNCHRPGTRRVYYHTAVCAAALSRSSRSGLCDQRDVARKAFHAVLARQSVDGSFPFSRRDYGVLHDDRSYPRNLAMILLHLLSPA